MNFDLSKGLYNWALFNDKKTYDFQHYIEDGTIKMTREIFNKLKRFLLESLVERKYPLTYVKKVEYKMDCI